MTASDVRKPALVWLKAQAPGFRHDGSEFATLRLAEVVAGHFELHLVCLATPATSGDPTTACCPPFSSVTVVRPDHQRGPLIRMALGGWWTALDRLGVRPLAASVEGCRSMRAAARERVIGTGARVALAEYWSMGRALRTCGASVRVMRLIDVEHLNVLHGRGAGLGWHARKVRARSVRRNERAAAHAATDVLFVSREDQADFGRIGVEGHFLPVTLPAAAGATIHGGGNRLAFVGSMSWWPNREGLSWFLDQVMPLIVADRPDVELRVFGGGDAAALARQFDPVNVRLMGFVPDLARELSECDIAVVPVIGGTGVKTKTLELLAAGLPVVTTHDGARGTPAVREGAKVVDLPRQFADAVLSLLADPDQRRELAADGVETVRREHCASHTVEWVDSIRARMASGAR